MSQLAAELSVTNKQVYDWFNYRRRKNYRSYIQQLAAGGGSVAGDADDPDAGALGADAPVVVNRRGPRGVRAGVGAPRLGP